MKIVRDGKEFELTQEELRKAYEAKNMEYLKEDVASQLEEDEDLDDVDLELIAERFEDALEHNNGYWDHYWGTMGYVIDEYIKENKNNDKRRISDKT